MTHSGQIAETSSNSPSMWTILTDSSMTPESWTGDTYSSNFWTTLTQSTVATVSVASQAYDDVTRIYNVISTDLTEATQDALNMTSFTDVTTPETDSESTTSSSMQLSIVYYVIGLIGVLGNGFTVAVVGSSDTMRASITNIFIINQSVLDFAVSFLLICTAQINSNVPFSGIAGEIYCRVWSTKLFLWAACLASTYNLVALSIERYLKVVLPIWHKVAFTRRMAFVAIGIVNTGSVIYQCVAFISTSGIKDGSCRLYYKWPSPTWRRIYGISVVLQRFFIPLAIFVYTYTHIAVVLRNKMKEKAGPGNSSSVAAANWQRGMRSTIKMLAIICITYVLCWSINQIYYFMFNVGYPSDFTSDLYHASVALVFINSIVNPFIYAFKYKQYKVEARKLLARCLPIGLATSVAPAAGTNMSVTVAQQNNIDA